MGEVERIKELQKMSKEELICLILDLEKELSFELVRAEPEIFSRKEKLAPKLDGGDNGIGDILAKYKK